MFTTSSKNHKYYIKPINYPNHIQIFNQKLKSYHNLPLHITKFNNYHHNKPSNSLHNLIHIHKFTQNNTHIFYTKKQIHNKINKYIHLIYNIYNTFNFKKIIIKLSTHPKKHINNNKM